MLFRSKLRDIPKKQSFFILETPNKVGPWSAKPVAEHPIVVVAPVVLNAVADATGIEFTRLPGNVDGFCIVSSDSDFTSLARRLMESGVMVIGMGESDKATDALENAYDKFVYIDLLAKQDQEEKLAEERQRKLTEKANQTTNQENKENRGANPPSKKAVEAKIQEIIMENDDRSKPTDLGQIGNELSRMFKNFDVRYYNRRGGKRYKYLKEFVGDFKSLEITVATDNRVYVSIK